MTNTTTAAATSTDVVATAHRQPATPPTAPVITRPDKPPSVVPAMYSPPMPAGRVAGARATRWAIASAGSAPSANPATARSTRRTSKEGANGSAAPATAATTADARIAPARPIRSPTAAQGSTDTASAPVATDTARDVADSDRLHSAASAGSTACTA